MNDVCFRSATEKANDSVKNVAALVVLIVLAFMGIGSLAQDLNRRSTDDWWHLADMILVLLGGALGIMAVIWLVNVMQAVKTYERVAEDYNEQCEQMVEVATLAIMGKVSTENALHRIAMQFYVPAPNLMERRQELVDAIDGRYELPRAPKPDVAPTGIYRGLTYIGIGFVIVNTLLAVMEVLPLLLVLVALSMLYGIYKASRAIVGRIRGAFGIDERTT